MNTEKSINEAEGNAVLPLVSERFNNEDFITNVCLSYRHDYGLLSNNDRNILRFECKEWMRAIINNWDNKRTHVFQNVR